MNNQYTTNLILERMKSQPKGTVFSTNDFLDLAIYDTVRSSLARLVKRGEIYRLLDGFFTIPYFMTSVGEYSYPAPRVLAQKIADKYKWVITPYGDTALNYLGLTTQMTNTIEYLSTGPYKEYTYKGTKIIFKHTSKLLNGVSSHSRELMLVVQSLRAIGRNNINNGEYYRLKKYCHEHLTDSWKTDALTAPKWIYDILRRIMEEKKNE